MDLDVAQTASTVMPYATAVVAAYGKDTVDKIRDLAVGRASDATVDLGQRLLSRILRREQSKNSIEEALTDVADGQDGAEPALQLQIRKALASDLELARDVIAMLPLRGDASGANSIAMGANSGIASTGEKAFNVREQINNGPGTFIGRDFNFGSGRE